MGGLMLLLTLLPAERGVERLPANVERLQPDPMRRQISEQPGHFGGDQPGSMRCRFEAQAQILRATIDPHGDAAQCVTGNAQGWWHRSGRPKQWIGGDSRRPVGQHQCRG